MTEDSVPLKQKQVQALRAATTAVAVSGLPFGVPGFVDVQSLCVESFLQSHQGWLVHEQPGRWVAEATTIHSQVWVVLEDPKSRPAQQRPGLRPLTSSPTISRARGGSHRACLCGLRSPSLHWQSVLSTTNQHVHEISLDNCIHSLKKNLSPKMNTEKMVLKKMYEAVLTRMSKS